MRFVLVALIALFASPAFAQGWDSYGNARFGYSIEIPPGFEGSGESANGDGQSFYNPKGAMGVAVWGGNVLDEFEEQVTSAMGYATSENGYAISYQATTPRWASFSGLNGSRILYQRMILLCDGSSYAAFRLEYSTINAADMKPIVEQMVTSLRADGC